MGRIFPILPKGRLGTVVILGNHDYGVDRSRAQLVLSHNPDNADQGDWSGYQGRILSGHTHGGQCKPPFLPAPLLPVKNRRYTAGHIPLADGRSLYISRGLGYLHQVRFNVRPEITVFTLTDPKA